jgi:hypothetical protein
MRTYRWLVIVACAAVLATMDASGGGILFSEDFGSLSDAAALTPSNTAFTYIRLSAGASPILEAQSPGSFTGSSLLLGATTTSLSGVGVSGGYTPFNIGELSFDVRLPSGLASNSTLFFGVGTGPTFTKNVTFSGNELTAGFQIHQYKLQTRTSTNVWADVGELLSPDANYRVDIYFNGSSSPYDYGKGSVDAGAADVYVRGVLMGKSVSIRNVVNTSAFRIYATSVPAGSAYELDNVTLVDYTVPEPSVAMALMAGWALIAGTVRRRK